MGDAPKIPGQTDVWEMLGQEPPPKKDDAPQEMRAPQEYADPLDLHEGLHLISPSRVAQAIHGGVITRVTSGTTGGMSMVIEHTNGAPTVRLSIVPNMNPWVIAYVED